MSQVFIRDNYLYLEFEYYEPLIGYRQGIEKVPVDQINYISENTGPRGGFLGWDIFGKEKNDVSMNGAKVEFKRLTSFGRKQYELFDETKKLLLPLGIKFIVKQEAQ